MDLDRPPIWWHSQATDHMAAHEVRTYPGTTGALLPFLLLSACPVLLCRLPLINILHCHG